MEQVLGRDEVLHGSVHQIGLVKKSGIRKDPRKGFTGVYLIQVKSTFSPQANDVLTVSLGST